MVLETSFQSKLLSTVRVTGKSSVIKFVFILYSHWKHLSWVSSILNMRSARLFHLDCPSVYSLWFLG